MHTHNILNSKSLELPNNGSLNNPKLAQKIKVARHLSKGLPYINSGGCGIFASMLDSIFNGDIIQLRLIRREYLFEIKQYDMNLHEILLKDGICYDAFNACSLSTLLKLKNIKSIITMEKLSHQTKPNRFFLIKRNSQSIIDDYKEGLYNPFFANREKMTCLFKNYQEVLDSLPRGIKLNVNPLKVKTIEDSYYPIMKSIAA